MRVNRTTRADLATRSPAETRAFGGVGAGGATIVVAPSDATASSKAGANIVLPGGGGDAAVLGPITALSGPIDLLILEGTVDLGGLWTIHSDANGTRVRGSGPATTVIGDVTLSGSSVTFESLRMKVASGSVTITVSGYLIYMRDLLFDSQTTIDVTGWDVTMSEITTCDTLSVSLHSSSSVVLTNLVVGELNFYMNHSGEVVIGPVTNMGDMWLTMETCTGVTVGPLTCWGNFWVATSSINTNSVVISDVCVNEDMNFTNVTGTLVQNSVFMANVNFYTCNGITVTGCMCPNRGYTIVQIYAGSYFVAFIRNDIRGVAFYDYGTGSVISGNLT